MAESFSLTVNSTIASQTEIVYVSLNPVRNDKPKSLIYFTKNYRQKPSSKCKTSCPNYFETFTATRRRRNNSLIQAVKISARVGDALFLLKHAGISAQMIHRRVNLSAHCRIYFKLQPSLQRCNG